MGVGGDQVGLLAVKSEYDDLEKGLLSTKQNIENKKKKQKSLGSRVVCYAWTAVSH